MNGIYTAFHRHLSKLFLSSFNMFQYAVSIYK